MEMNKPAPYTRMHYFFVKVMTSYDLSLRRIPVMEIKSTESGPVVVVTACMHGDEIGGTVVVHELFKRLKNILRRGKVIAFPLLNPFGFENASRRISISNEDLNRSFPGKHKGSLGQRIAAILMDRIQELEPSIVLDLHNDWNKSIPYVLIDSLKEHKTLPVLHHFAKTSQMPAIQEAVPIATSFSYAANLKNIPALTLELGESLLINEKNVSYGVTAVLNILHDLGMVGEFPDEMVYRLPEPARNKILTYSEEPLCSSSGIIRFWKKPGEIVRRGDKIAKVFNAFGKLNETIVSLHDGIILGHNDWALAYPGSSVMSFGVFDTSDS